MTRHFHPMVVSKSNKLAIKFESSRTNLSESNTSMGNHNVENMDGIMVERKGLEVYKFELESSV